MTNEKTVQRSWNESEESVAGKKWSGIIILSLIGIALLSWYILGLIPKDKSKVFFSTLVVEEYSEEYFPVPAYGSKGADLADSDWKSIDGGASPAGDKSTFVSQLESLQHELENKEKAERKDSLVLYLRCHAAVLDSSESESTSPDGCFLLFNESKPYNKKTWLDIEDLIEQLRKLPTGKVVVLADICDLTSAPAFGCKGNDLRSWIGKALKENSAGGGPEIWFLLSADSGQPSHESWLRGRTLLQASCEYSLARLKKQKVSLGNFYEHVLRYAAHETDGEQTPILLHKNASSVSPKSSKEWSKAEQFVMREEPEESENEEQDAESESSEDNTIVAAAAGVQAEVDGSEGETGPAKVADNNLGFWQSYDRFLSEHLLSSTPSRSPIVHHSPVVFAPKEWFDLVEQASVLTRYKMIGRLADSEKTESERIRADLEQLFEAIKQEKKCSGIDERSTTDTSKALLNAWNEVCTEIGKSGAMQAWEDSRRNLGPKVAAEWDLHSARLLEHAEAVRHMHGLLHRGRYDSEVNGKLEEQQGELQRTQLAETALKIVTVKQLTAPESNWPDLPPNPERPLSWSTERTWQGVLLNPVTPFQKRKEAWDILNRKTKLDFRGAASEIKEKNDPIEKLLKKAVLPPDSSIRKLCEELEFFDSMHRTGLGLFVERDDEPDDIGYSQRLPPISDDSSLVVRRYSDTGAYFEDQGSLHYAGEEVFQLEVRQACGRPVENLSFKWAADSPQKLKLKLISGVNDQEIAEGDFHRIRELSQEGLLNLHFSHRSPDWDNDPKGIEIALEFSQGRGRSEVEKKVTVFPPRPDRIELLAKRLNPIADQEVWIKETLDGEESRRLDSLAVLALGTAKTRYQFFLTNKFKDEKRVRVELFGVNADQRENGKMPQGKIAMRSQLEKLQGIPIFSSAVVHLPSAASGDATPIEVVLTAPPEERTIGFPVGGMVVKLTEGPPDPANENDFLPTEVRTHYCWVDVQTLNPLTPSLPRQFSEFQLIKISREESREIDSMRFQVDVDSEVWDELDVEKTIVSGFLSDTSGTIVSSSESEIELSRDLRSGKLTLTPNSNEGNEDKRDYVAHFSVKDVYPRAVAFEAPRKALDQPMRAQTSFFWCSPKDIQFLPAQPELIAQQFITKIESASKQDFEEFQLLIPKRLGVQAASDGKPFEAKTIIIKPHFDPRLSSSTKLRVKLNGSAKELASRVEFAQASLMEGEFEGAVELSGKVEDPQYEIEIQDLKSGENELVFSAAGSEKILQRIRIVKDRKPPKIASLKVKSRILDAKGMLTLVVEASDDTGIESVFFAVDAGSNNGRYDPADLLVGTKSLTASREAPGVWEATLKGEEFAAVAGGGKTYGIVCKVVDKAGNSTDQRGPSSRPVSFEWKPSKE